MRYDIDGGVKILLDYSRLPGEAIGTDERSALRGRLAPWLADSDDLTLVLPAFPHKSPNHRDKVLGAQLTRP